LFYNPLVPLEFVLSIRGGHLSFYALSADVQRCGGLAQWRL